MNRTDPSSLRIALACAALMIAGQAAVLFSFGQPPICTCGYVKLWEGVVLSPGNSQHLTDWYTFSHIIHGMLFYALTWLLFPRLPVGYRLLMALGIEIAWEITENTPFVINRYREQALAQGYSGDSILNSVSDSLSMAFGFLLARLLPVWGTVGLALAMEVSVAYFIRDNLTLNVINLLYPLDFVHRWQSGGN
jgi:hypothetical protein